MVKFTNSKCFSLQVIIVSLKLYLHFAQITFNLGLHLITILFLINYQWLLLLLFIEIINDEIGVINFSSLKAYHQSVI